MSCNKHQTAVDTCRNTKDAVKRTKL